MKKEFSIYNYEQLILNKFYLSIDKEIIDLYFIIFAKDFNMIDITTYNYTYLDFLSKLMASHIYYETRYFETISNEINLFMYSRDSDIIHMFPKGSHFYDIVTSYMEEYNKSREEVFEIIKNMIIGYYIQTLFYTMKRD